MTSFLRLFTRNWFFALAVLSIGGAGVQLGLDARAGLLMLGALLVLAGAGQALLGREQGSRLHKVAAAVLVLFGLFMMTAMAVMLALGERL